MDTIIGKIMDWISIYDLATFILGMIIRREFNDLMDLFIEWECSYNFQLLGYYIFDWLNHNHHGIYLEIGENFSKDLTFPYGRHLLGSDFSVNKPYNNGSEDKTVYEAWETIIFNNYSNDPINFNIYDNSQFQRHKGPFKSIKNYIASVDLNNFFVYKNYMTKAYYEYSIGRYIDHFWAYAPTFLSIFILIVFIVWVIKNPNPTSTTFNAKHVENKEERTESQKLKTIKAQLSKLYNFIKTNLKKIIKK